MLQNDSPIWLGTDTSPPTPPQFNTQRVPPAHRSSSANPGGRPVSRGLCESHWWPGTRSGHGNAMEGAPCQLLAWAFSRPASSRLTQPRLPGKSLCRGAPEPTRRGGPGLRSRPPAPRHTGDRAPSTRRPGGPRDGQAASPGGQASRARKRLFSRPLTLGALDTRRPSGRGEDSSRTYWYCCCFSGNRCAAHSNHPGFHLLLVKTIQEYTYFEKSLPPRS